MSKIKPKPTLDALFDSPIRIRLLKLFLFSPDKDFTVKMISKVLNIDPRLIKNHLNKLSELQFVISKNGSKPIFKTNKNFIFFNELKELVTKASPASKEKMLKRLNDLGGVKLVILSGIFSPPKADQFLVDTSDNSQVDLLVVGDKINSARFDKFLKELEAEIGKEVNCALMTLKEFNYRYSMYDRFVRDLLDFKHEKLINKLRI